MTTNLRRLVVIRLPLTFLLSPTISATVDIIHADTDAADVKRDWSKPEFIADIYAWYDLKTVLVSETEITSDPGAEDARADKISRKRGYLLPPLPLRARRCESGS